MENLNSPSIFDHFRGNLKKAIYKNLGKNYVKSMHYHQNFSGSS